jgi:hypothetical protein
MQHPLMAQVVQERVILLHHAYNHANERDKEELME